MWQYHWYQRNCQFLLLVKKENFNQQINTIHSKIVFLILSCFVYKFVRVICSWFAMFLDIDWLMIASLYNGWRRRPDVPRTGKFFSMSIFVQKLNCQFAISQLIYVFLIAEPDRWHCEGIVMLIYYQLVSFRYLVTITASCRRLQYYHVAPEFQFSRLTNG